MVIDPSTIKVSLSDFINAMNDITPSAHRSALNYAKPIPTELETLINDSFKNLCNTILKHMPEQMIKSLDKKANFATNIEDSDGIGIVVFNL